MAISAARFLAYTKASQPLEARQLMANGRESNSFRMEAIGDPIC